MLTKAKIAIIVGFICLLHAAYSAAQHRSYIRLTEQDFVSLPLDIIVQTIFSFLLICIGVVNFYDKFQEIEATAELRDKTWDLIGNRPSFYIFHHRGVAIKQYK